jgi:bacillolysin
MIRVGIRLAQVLCMRNLIGSFGVLGGLGVFLVSSAQVVACSDAGRSGDDEVPVDLSNASPEQRVAFAALKASTGVKWQLSQHAALRTPAHLSGVVGALSGVKPFDATVSFLSTNRALFRMHAPALEFQLKREKKDELAMTHVRLQQMVRGVPVQGGELMAHYGADGSLQVIDANYVAGLENLDVNPTLSLERAKVAALGNAKSLNITTDAAKTSEPELIVYAPSLNVEGGGEAKLAYSMHVSEISAQHYALRKVVVDAHDGSILSSFNNLQALEGNGMSATAGVSRKLQVSQEGGQYVLKDASRGNGVWTYTAEETTTSAIIVSSNSLNTWDDVQNGAGAAVDAHFFAGKVYDFYKGKFARNSLDNNNLRMVSVVHYDQQLPNAFWNPDSKLMAYGDGDGSTAPFSASLDVVGHEFTHGVTSNESDLQYMNQSGALNEALSDILGSAIEHEVMPSATANWQMGEGLGKPIRDMKSPKLYRQPDHMSGYQNTQQDNGGVHTNSGIINQVAYLMTMGGKNSTSNITVPRGIGWDKMAQVFYRTNTTLLMQNSNFAAMSAAARTAATQLTFTANEQKIVACAFVAVGLKANASETCQALLPDGDGAPDAGAPTVDAGAAPKADAGSTPKPDASVTGPSGDTGDDEAVAEAATSNGAQAQPDPDGALKVQDSSGCSATGASGSHGPGRFAMIVGMAAFALATRRSRKRNVCRK